MESKIYEAICGVMEDVGAVKKTDKNEFDKYMYRGIDAVMNALQPAMIKHHVFCIPEVVDMTREDRIGKNGSPLVYSVATVKYTFYTDDGSSVSALVIGEAMDRGDKSMNKAMSAAFKYAMFQTFCIPTEEMIDSEKDSPEVAETSQEMGERLLKKPSEKQINCLNALWKKADDLTKMDILKKYPDLTAISMKEASEIIGVLKDGSAGGSD